MPRPKLNRKIQYVQFVLDADDKLAFEVWCAANRTTMSDVIRKEISPYVSKGKKMQEASSEIE